MSAGGARRGRRDNGLDATEYAVAGDVDPRVGEHLLDVLAVGGIAAYLQPSSDLNPVTRTTTVPARPVDRLYVDRSHVDTARDYLAHLTADAASADGGPTDAASADDAPAAPARSVAADSDVDAVWAGIIAGYHAQVDPTAPPWPAAENLSADRSAGGDTDSGAPGQPANTGTPVVGVASTGPVPSTDADSTSGGGHDRPSPATDAGRWAGTLPSATEITNISVGRRTDEPSFLDGLDTFGSHLPDDPEEGYTPPPPPPLPRLSKFTVLGTLAIVVGFALFLFPTLLPVDRTLAIVLGFSGVVGGFVTLIWRLRPDRDEDADPDDGAVV